MPQTQIRLTDEQMTILTELAAKRQQSVEDLIHESIDRLLQSVTGPGAADRRQRALAVAGRFRSGLGDLARQHDTYLNEAFD